MSELHTRLQCTRVLTHNIELITFPKPQKEATVASSGNSCNRLHQTNSSQMKWLNEGIKS